MRILLPAYLSARTIYSVIGQTLTDRFDPRSDRFRFDFSPLVAVEPAGVAALAHLIQTLRQSGASCTPAIETTSAPEPALLTLHHTAFFDDVFSLPNPFPEQIDVSWMPLTHLQPASWHPHLEARVFKWIATRLGISRFAPGWKLTGIASLHPGEGPGPSTIYASARIDAERGRLALAFAGHRVSDTEQTFRRMLTGLPDDTEYWIGLHAGWELYHALSTTPGSNRLPSPVPYPGWLLDSVFSIAGLLHHPQLNEPDPFKSFPGCDETTNSESETKRVAYPGVQNTIYP